MAQVHLILQNKGGVGKSFLSVMFAQHKIAKGGTRPVCIDLDPMTPTFSRFKALNAVALNIMDGDEIDSRAFDNLIEIIASSKGDVIVDNGSSTFPPFLNYIKTNKIPGLLSEMGHEIVMHLIVTGGQAMASTLQGMEVLAKEFKGQVRIIVWLNPFFGPIEDGGIEFEKMKQYKNSADAIDAIVKIPLYKKETHGRDLNEMLTATLTFDEAMKSSSLGIVPKHRLALIKGDLFTLMNAIPAL